MTRKMTLEKAENVVEIHTASIEFVAKIVCACTSQTFHNLI
jgi:hypothetical protein